MPDLTGYILGRKEIKSWEEYGKTSAESVRMLYGRE